MADIRNGPVVRLGVRPLRHAAQAGDEPLDATRVVRAAAAGDEQPRPSGEQVGPGVIQAFALAAAHGVSTDERRHAG